MLVYVQKYFLQWTKALIPKISVYNNLRNVFFIFQYFFQMRKILRGWKTYGEDGIKVDESCTIIVRITEITTDVLEIPEVTTALLAQSSLGEKHKFISLYLPQCKYKFCNLYGWYNYMATSWPSITYLSDLRYYLCTFP